MSDKDYLSTIVFAKITLSFKKMAWKIIGTFHTCGNTWKYELKNVKSNKISNTLFL